MDRDSTDGPRKIAWEARYLALALSIAGCGGPTRGTTVAREAGGGGDGTVQATDAPAGVAADAAVWPDVGPGGVPLWQDITPAGVSLDFSNPSANYGTQVIQVSPTNPSIVYFGTCYQGIWKSIDGGDHFTKVSTGANGANLETGRNWTLALDPTDANVLYTVAGYGSGQGIWKSTDGGVDWTQIETAADMSALTADIYDITIDPYNHQHVLVASHSPWASFGDAGVLETSDAGATWTQHNPVAGWGAGHWIAFLDNSSTWLLATQGDGIWRTADAGSTWKQVTTNDMQHGGWGVYRSKAGVLYAGGLNAILRSTDDGLSWSSVGPATSDGYYTVIGDGVYLYAQPGNTGGSTTGSHPYYVSLESDGTSWRPYNGQLFGDGPMSMSIDPIHHILFSSNWDTGVWRLVTGH